MRLHTMTLAALLPLATATATAASAAAAELKITITGAGPTGQVMVKLFGSVDSFEKMGPSVAALTLPPSGGQVSVTIGDLPPGRYAIAAFQDAKRTGKLERNLIGIPTEPYGFSNDAVGTMGPPSFERAAFTVGAHGAAITLHLR